MTTLFGIIIATLFIILYLIWADKKKMTFKSKSVLLALIVYVGYFMLLLALLIKSLTSL